MRKSRGLATLLAAALLWTAACTGSSDETPRTTGTGEETSPSASPSASPSPTSTPANVALETVADGFANPVHAAFAPGDARRLYVVERDGLVFEVDLRTDERSRRLDIRSQVRTEGEEGLLSIAFHPDFAAGERNFYAYYNDTRGDVRIDEFSVTRSSPARRERSIFRLDKPELVTWHNGGQVQFGPDGLLYFATGDAARNPLDGQPNPPDVVDPNNHSQDLGLPYGKLYRIDVNRSNAKVEMVAYGLRNPWRFSFDRADGSLYIGDVGQFSWEEIDRADVVGSNELLNFGWSQFEGREIFEPNRLNDEGRLLDPIAVYEHDAGGYCPGNGSVVGGHVYRGDAIPELADRYVYGDFCSGEVFSFDTASPNESRVEPITLYQLVSFAEDPEGELYLVGMSDGIVQKIVEGP